MEKIFIPHETDIPVLAKEKGFDKPCFGYYWNKYNYSPTTFKTQLQICSLGEEQESANIRRHTLDIVAPTYEQIKDWFREEHNIHIMYMICGSRTKVLGYKWFVQIGMNEDDCYQTKMIKDYYVGMTEAIKEALNKI